ncbi:MAG: hypothetical protein R6W85_08165 [Gillisia sp.]
MNSDPLKPLGVTFILSGVWDTVAGMMYFFVIGTGRLINDPPMDSFFSIFLGSFFICFAYLQFMSAFNIRRYAFNVGCLILGRTFYVVLLLVFMLLVKDFPTTFWFTGIIDGGFTIMYFVFALRGGLNMRDIFLPKIGNSNGEKEFQEV